MRPIEHILVATDFGRASERATSLAIEMAKAFGANVTLLHAYWMPEDAYGGLPEIAEARLREEAEEKLDAAVARVASRGCAADGLLRRIASSDEIATIARDTRADMVVMGTHGRRGIPRLVLGSVAERTVRFSAVPVLTASQCSFENRHDAGGRLATAMASLRTEVPTVVALSRGAVPIGVDIARALDCSVDVLLVDPLVTHSGAVVGALCEDGTSVIDTVAADAAQVTRRELDETLLLARRSLPGRVQKLRGARWLAQLTGRTVIVVCDSLTTAHPVAVATSVLRSLGARRVVLAVPACSTEVLADASKEADRTFCLEVVDGSNEPRLVYRDPSEPGDREAAQLLLEAAGSAAPRSAAQGHA